MSFGLMALSEAFDASDNIEEIEEKLEELLNSQAPVLIELECYELKRAGFFSNEWDFGDKSIIAVPFGAIKDLKQVKVRGKTCVIICIKGFRDRCIKKTLKEVIKDINGQVRGPKSP